jgi:hypothetical protein
MEAGKDELPKTGLAGETTRLSGRDHMARSSQTTWSKVKPISVTGKKKIPLVRYRTVTDLVNFLSIGLNHGFLQNTQSF